MARDWTEVRKEMVAKGQIDEAKSAEHQRRMLAEVRAYRLAEVRKAQQVTQVELAKAMDVTQSRVSRLEKGQLDATELGTIKKYVEALGGELRLIADFGAAGTLPVGDFVLHQDDRELVLEGKHETTGKRASVTPGRNLKSDAGVKQGTGQTMPRRRRSKT